MAGAAPAADPLFEAVALTGPLTVAPALMTAGPAGTDGITSKFPAPDVPPRLSPAVEPLLDPAGEGT